MKSVRSNVEGAFLAALTVLLYLASIYIPILGFMLSFLSPLPVMFLVIRWNLRTGLMAAGVASMLVFAFAGIMQALVCLLGFTTLGAAMGCMIKRKSSFFEVLGYTTVVSILSKLALIGLAVLVTGVHPITANLEIMEEAFTRTSEIFGGVGLENFETLMNLIQMALPAILIVASLIDTSLNFFLGSWAGRKIGITFPDHLPFERWRFPRSVFWMFALSWLLVMFGGEEGVGRVGLNLQMVTQMLFLVQGFSLAYFFLNKYIKTKGVTIGLLLLAFFQPFLTVVLSWAGILDAWLDLRKLKTPPSSSGGGEKQ